MSDGVNDITGFGLQINIVASNTYPQGITVTQFADDADPLDVPPLTLAEAAAGLNGDLIVWSKAAPLVATINIIPGSDNDNDLSFLAEANRVGKGKTSARDVITAIVTYPDGEAVTYRNGKLTAAPAGKSVASAGRMKTGAYAFVFESRTKS